MLIESSDLDLLAGQLALSFDDNHRRFVEGRLLNHRPAYIATPLVNPIETFGKTLRVLAAARRTIVTQAEMLADVGHVEFSVFGDEVSARMRLEPDAIGADIPSDVTATRKWEGSKLDFHVEVDNASFETLMERMVRLGMLQTILGEATETNLGYAAFSVGQFTMTHLVEPHNYQRPSSFGMPQPILANLRWNTVGEDLEMLTEERVVIGLRSQWVRRVASPIWHAWHAMKADEGRKGGMRAFEIMKQCTDLPLRYVCASYLNNKFNLTGEEQDRPCLVSE